MNPAMAKLQRGLIHAIKHALAAWSSYLDEAQGKGTTLASESPAGESERKAGRR